MTMIMMIKDHNLQMFSIIDFIYIHKTIRQVSTDELLQAGVALGLANVAFGDFCFYLVPKNGCWR
jgi:ABC-type cobalamin transport system permease subunit